MQKSLFRFSLYMEWNVNKVCVFEANLNSTQIAVTHETQNNFQKQKLDRAIFFVPVRKRKREGADKRSLARFCKHLLFFPFEFCEFFSLFSNYIAFKSLNFGLKVFTAFHFLCSILSSNCISPFETKDLKCLTKLLVLPS